jgi:integrase
MFHLAVADGKLTAIPHIEMLPEAPPRKGFLEVEEFRRLRQHLPEHLRPVLTLGYYSGMRLGEIRHLKWENVDLAENSIRLYNDETKSGEPRLVPLISELPTMFKMLRQQSKSAYVFGNGQPLGSFRKAWQTACVKAELGKKEKLEDGTVVYSGITFHDLRRSGVRNLVRSGVPERVAMAISGHKTRAVFERYNIVSERDLKEAGTRLSAYLEAQSPKAETLAQKDAVQPENGENTVKVRHTQ